MKNPLDIFHPLIRDWFRARVGTPTDVQARAWPVIAAGKHALITAPTGSGKTLTAFLWGLNQLITGAWPRGNVRLLYVSPLKALNNDIQQNLLTPLDELRQRFVQAGEPFPEISALTRSGDTESSERQRMLRRPPEILITTPESLNLLLSARKSRDILTGIATVILDEIHAVAASKRGTHLITAVERLVRLSGEFQRIGISATVRPLEVIADFVGGYVVRTVSPHVHGGLTDRPTSEERYEKRPVEVVVSSSKKKYSVSIHFPRDESGAEAGIAPLLPRVAGECKRVIRKNRSTLLFTNNRRHCETISLLINQDEPEMLAYSHHGSLSREMRTMVEQRLKRGELKAIVATSSLELGIDIGALDEVILIGTPLSVSSGVQRVGRAGHQVGVTSRGTIFPLHGRDAIDAAVMAPAILEQDIEETAPFVNPLDVLAQVIVSMVGTEKWALDELFDFIRASWPYHTLTRRHFDLLINMLAGRYRESRLRALQPLIFVDGVSNTATGRENALRLLYSSGGTIPDRGYFNLRRIDTHAKIGELDEEFVWERSLGDAFSLGVQSWKIADITHNDVLVEPSRPKASDVPFWKAEDLNRAYHFSEKIGVFMEEANALLRHDETGKLEHALAHNFHLDAAASDVVVGFLKRQRAATHVDLPHRHHVVIEHFTDKTETEPSSYIILHTLWGGKINRPLAFALAQAWEDTYGQRLQVFSNNDCIVLLLPIEAENFDVFSLVNPEAFESLLRKKLEQTGFFGARFRENAARALLLPRQSFNRRMPLWVNRLRSQKLLEAVSRYEDFPILIETWRTCLHDEFDLEGLRRLLYEIQDGQIAVTDATTEAPSPFAGGIVWRLTNYYMYADDTPHAAGPSRLKDDLIQEAVHSAELRPQLSRELVRTFEHKAQRLFDGYAPRSPEELIEWVKERLLIPVDEWDALLKAMTRDHELKKKHVLEEIRERVVSIEFEGYQAEGIVAVESIERLLRALDVPIEKAVLSSVSLPGTRRDDIRLAPGRSELPEDDDPLAQWISEWLRFYGPRDPNFIQAALPIDETRLMEAIETLLDERAIVVDHLTAPGDTLEICDAENLEILLRLSRARARSTIEALPLKCLPLFVAHHQGLTARWDTAEDPEANMHRALEALLGHPLPAALLESDVLPARIAHYATAMLDAVMSESDLMWFGEEGKKIVLTFSHAHDLFADAARTVSPREPSPDTRTNSPRHEDEKEWEELAAKLFADTRGQYYFTTLLDNAKLSSAQLAQSLWHYVWQGRITNDTFAALRKGIITDFKVKEPAMQARVSRRAQFSAWKTARAYPGTWRMLSPPDSGDVIDEEELNKDRVRVLLARYGVLFRELLARELPALRWGTLFRTLRRMELSGEIVAGNFFEGVPGLQFASHAALRALQQPLSEDAIYWMNATDPASICGVELPDLKKIMKLPARAMNTHVVFRGTKLMLVSRRNGKELDVYAPLDDPSLSRYFDFMRNMLGRSFQPVRKIAIEKINGETAVESQYLDALREFFDISADAKNVWVWKKTAKGP